MKVFCVFSCRDVGTGVMRYGASETYEDWMTLETLVKIYASRELAQSYVNKHSGQFVIKEATLEPELPA